MTMKMIEAIRLGLGVSAACVALPPAGRCGPHRRRPCSSSSSGPPEGFYPPGSYPPPSDPSPPSSPRESGPPEGFYPPGSYRPRDPSPSSSPRESGPPEGFYPPGSYRSPSPSDSSRNLDFSNRFPSNPHRDDGTGARSGEEGPVDLGGSITKDMEERTKAAFREQLSSDQKKRFDRGNTILDWAAAAAKIWQSEDRTKTAVEEGGSIIGAWSWGTVAAAGTIGVVGFFGGPVALGVTLGAVAAYGAGRYGSEYLRDVAGRTLDNVRSMAADYGEDGKKEPIVLDLDGDGVELIPVNESTALFFKDDEGYGYRSGWVASDDGILVYDKESDGVITANDEVSMVEYVHGQMSESEALVSYDSNHDGVLTDLEALRYFDNNGDDSLDANDADFFKFRIWQDLDQDGEVDSEREVQTLGVKNIESIGLSYRAGDDGEDESVRGNVVHGIGEYRYRDASGILRTRDVADVSFAVDGRVGIKKTADEHYQYKVADDVYHIHSFADNTDGSVVDFRDQDWAQHIGVMGGLGDDVFRADGIADRDFVLQGGAGDDRLIGGASDDWLIGGEGADNLDGGTGNDILVVDSADSVDGGGGRDYVISTSQQEDASIVWYMSQMNIEALDTGDNQDVVYVGGSPWDANDRADSIVQRFGAVVYGNGGDDTIHGGRAGDILTGDDGVDVLNGNDGDDVLAGGAGADTLNGGAGDDWLLVDSADSYQGGAGFDTLWFVDDEAHDVDLNEREVERVYGGGGDDALFVEPDYGKAHLHFDGGAGDDRLRTGTGDDYLHGGLGNDLLIGGLGNDLYVLYRGGGHDRIGDLFLYDGRLREAGEADTLALGGDVALTDLVFYFDSGDLQIGIKPVGDDTPITNVAGFEALSDRVTIIAWTHFLSPDNQRVEYLRLGDGTRVNLENFVSAYNLSTGGVKDLSVVMGAGVVQGVGSDVEVFNAEREGVTSVKAGGGDDAVFGHLQGDTLDGGGGEDTVSYASYDGVDERGVSVDLSALAASLESLESGDDAFLRDTLKGFENVVGSAYDDVIRGDDGANKLDGGSGDDVLYGQDGNDVYYFGYGAGHDKMVDTGGSDEIRIASGVDQSSIRFEWGLLRDYGNNGDDYRYDGTVLTLKLLDGNGEVTDSLLISDYRTSSGRIERIVLGDGEDELELRSPGSEVGIAGSSGDDKIEGTYYNDIYQMHRGSGHDVVTEYGGDDRVRIASGDGSSVRVLRSLDGRDLFIGLWDKSGNVTDSLLVKDHYVNESAEIESVSLDNRILSLANRVIWTREDSIGSAYYNEAYLWFDGGAGDDTLQTGAGSDYLHGGLGDDMLRGSFGDDIYVLYRGGGHDTIEDYYYVTTTVRHSERGFVTGYRRTEYDAGRSDILALGGDVALTDLVFYYESGNLQIGIKPVGDDTPVTSIAGFEALSDRVAINGWSNDRRRVEYLRLGDGTYVNLENFVSTYNLSSSGVKDLSVAMGAGIVQGVRNDAESFSAERDGVTSVNAGDGNDVVFGHVQGDALDGGGGEDTVSYVFYSGVDGRGVSVDLSAGAASQVLLESGDDALLQDTLTDFENVVGSAYDDMIRGDDGANKLAGGSGDDVLYGQDGNDVYYFGYGAGHDKVIDTGGLDEIRIAPSAGVSSVRLVRGGSEGYDLFIELLDGGEVADSLLVKDYYVGASARIENIHFSNPNISWLEHHVAARAKGIVGSSGNDYSLEGEQDINDVFDSDAGGDDTLRGLSGDDVYWLGRGTGQDTIDESYQNSGEGDAGDEIRIKAGIDASLVRLARERNNLSIRLLGGNDSLTVKGYYGNDAAKIERVVFADGITWDAEGIASNVLIVDGEIVGREGDDVLDGDLDVNDIFDADVGGDDTLRGLSGDDVYWLGRGTGKDTIDEYYQNSGEGDAGDEIRIKAGIEASSVRLLRSNDGDDLRVVLLDGEGNMTGDSLVVKSYYTDDKAKIERVVFADGVEWGSDEFAEARIVGGVGNDNLYGKQGAGDVFDSDAGGNDILRGKSGDDVYWLGRGSGEDKIDERYQNSGEGDAGDEIRIKEGIDASSVRLSRSNNGSNLRIVLLDGEGNVTNDSLVVSRYYAENKAKIERVMFADGGEWGADKFAEARITGGVGNEILRGTQGAGDIFDSDAGGDDILRGLSGDDVYWLGRGSGQDTIDESHRNSGNGDAGDEIRIKAGIDASSVRLFRSDDGDDLRIVLLEEGNVTGDSLVVKDYYRDDKAKIERVVFTDGVEWGADEFVDVPAVVRIVGGMGADDLYGTRDTDIFDSDVGGDDTLHGKSGNDVYWLGRGTGKDTIDEYHENSGDGDAGDKIRIKAGIDASSVRLLRSDYGDDLHVVLLDENGNMTDRLTVEGHYVNDRAKIERVVFADGLVWGADKLADNWIDGGVGDDYLYGRWGARDVFDSDAGGNDILRGYSGDDVYWLGRGTGRDTIDEYSWRNDEGDAGDEIRIKAGIDASSVQLSRNSSDLIISLLDDDGRETDDSLVVHLYFSDHAAAKVERIYMDGKVMSLYQALVDGMALFAADHLSLSDEASSLGHFPEDEVSLAGSF